MRLFVRSAATVVAAAALVAGCGTVTAKTESTPTGGTITVDVHDAWNMPQTVLDEFTKQTGYKVRIVAHDGVAKLADEAALNAGKPVGDVIYGLDNSYAGRVVSAGALADYVAPNQSPRGLSLALDGDAGKQLTATDFSDVCVNADDGWFTEHHLAKPASFDDLIKPQYAKLLTIPAASASSTGLAWLLGTISAKGDNWKTYWRTLLTNGANIASGWTQAYEGNFTAGGGKGTYPLVVSYSSSPPYTIPEGQTTPTTSAILDTCFRQVEYIGVLKGSANLAGAKAFVNFMVGKQAQATIPENMYMYPADAQVAIPELWTKWAPLAGKTWPLSQAVIAANRDAWVSQWRALFRTS